MKFVDEGFGFPVHLLNVPMIKVRGQWTPQINYAELSSAVMQALPLKAARLTGNEIRFIRQSFGMTLNDFAATFYVKHSAVIKWQKAENEPTKKNWATEKDIRLFILSQTGAEESLPEAYQKLRSEAPQVKRNTKIDIKSLKPISA